MTKRIEEDRKHFGDIIGGKIRKELQRLKKNSNIVRRRGKNGKLSITIPGIESPFIVHGSNGEGFGRGKGKPGDVIGKKPIPGEDPGDKPGDEEGEGIRVDIPLEDILKFLQDELKLPDLKPKNTQTFEDIKIKYTDISVTGPESLRHNRRTLKQAMRRLAGTGELAELKKVPGFPSPIPQISVISPDKRYRQYKEIRIPTSNAVIINARDWSGSMDEYKCDIVSDMSWWLDCWIRRFYKKTERVYIGHDVLAQEVDEQTFYKYRYGGGTKCSSALKAIADLFENRYKPQTWNIYVFYYSDGENWGMDNQEFVKILEEKFGPDVVNMVGIAQIECWGYNNSLKHYVDENISKNMSNLKTLSIGAEHNGGWGAKPRMGEEERNKQILDGIRYWLGGAKDEDQKEAKEAVA